MHMHRRLHAVNHQAGGIDVLNVAGLAGLLITPQTPILHAATHQAGGADLLNVAGLAGLLADPQTPLLHTIDKHTDVARYIFFPVGNKTTGSVAKQNVRDVHSLEDAVSDYSLIPFWCPNDFASITSFKVVWFGKAGPDGNKWYCDPALRYNTDTEVQNAHAETPAKLQITVPADSNVYFTDVGFTLAALAKQDVGGCEIEREAGDALDTYNGGTIHVMGMIMFYTAEQ